MSQMSKRNSIHLESTNRDLEYIRANWKTWKNGGTKNTGKRGVSLIYSNKSNILTSNLVGNE